VSSEFQLLSSGADEIAQHLPPQPDFNSQHEKGRNPEIPWPSLEYPLSLPGLFNCPISLSKPSIGPRILIA